MSIINNANPGSGLILLPMIERVLQSAQEPLSQDTLLARYRPDNLPANDNAWGKLKENLSFWCSLGLWPMCDAMLLPLEEDARPLAHRLLACAIDACREKGVASGNECEPLWRVLSCLLILQQHSFGGQEPLSPTIITNKVHKWLPGETINTNTEKLVREFGRFLGFLELMPDGNYVTDPTRAIQCFLPEIFGNTRTLPAKIFMANMAEVMPMMDGGQFRNSVHDLMQQEKDWSAPEGDNICTSTSVALQRLEISKRIILTTGSDDEDAFSLHLPDGKIRRISQITLREDAQ
ncbi:protein DpdG [Brenneria populi subsp. brevivirga]|uniref:protein DpdG n=1 Tax=Brenneria populi TaxID=1505588 RepID=UPI002E18CBEA|nr:protein DpdG [Brenneria populi subsp. brevivirga]